MAPRSGPRFLQRMEQSGQLYRKTFANPQQEPPPYPPPLREKSMSKMDSTTSLSTAPPQYSPAREPSPPYPYLSTPEESVLPRNSLILVTGANSFQGMHIVDQLLVRGFQVRGTVRDNEKARWTTKYFQEKYGRGRYLAVVIPDMVSMDAFDLAVRECVGVIHCAGVTKLSKDPLEVVMPTHRFATVLLHACQSKEGGRTVRRFVYCSSTTAAVEYDRRKDDVDSRSWNETSILAGWQGIKRSRGFRSESPDRLGHMQQCWALQCASKKQTEDGVWNWAKSNAHNFVINTVLPATLWGPTLDPQQKLPTSLTLLKRVFDGDAPSTAWCPPQNFIHVQDSALLHIAALLLPDVQSRRIFGAVAPWNINSLLDTLRRAFPNRVLPGDVSDHGVDTTNFVEKNYAEWLLSRMREASPDKTALWIGMEETLKETCQGWT